MLLVLGVFLQNFLTISGDLEREYQLLGWQKITLHSSCKILVWHSLCSRATRGVAVQNIHSLVPLTTGKMVKQIFWKTVVVKWNYYWQSTFILKKKHIVKMAYVWHIMRKKFLLRFFSDIEICVICIVYIRLFAHVILNFLLILRSIEIEMFKCFLLLFLSVYLQNIERSFVWDFGREIVFIFHCMICSLQIALKRCWSLYPPCQVSRSPVTSSVLVLASTAV